MNTATDQNMSLTPGQVDANEVAALLKAALKLSETDTCRTCRGTMLRPFADWRKTLTIGIHCPHCYGAYSFSSESGRIRLHCLSAPSMHRKTMAGFTLDTLVRRFARQPRVVRISLDPTRASGMCRDLSEDFLYYIITAPRAFELTSYSLTRLDKILIPPHDTLPESDSIYHYVANLNGTRYDWTARQFRKEARVPTIHRSLSKLRADWGASEEVEYEPPDPTYLYRGLIDLERADPSAVVNALWQRSIHSDAAETMPA